MEPAKDASIPVSASDAEGSQVAQAQQATPSTQPVAVATPESTPMETDGPAQEPPTTGPSVQEANALLPSPQPFPPPHSATPQPSQDTSMPPVPPPQAVPAQPLALFGPSGPTNAPPFPQMPYHVQQQQPLQPADPTIAVPAAPPSRYREGPAPVDHQPHPDCPDTLACLPDTDGRPQHTLPVILRCAILGSPQKRLTIRGIYAAMEENLAHLTTLASAHTGPVNLNAPPGTKRPRKRGKPGAAKAKKAAEADQDSAMDDNGASTSNQIGDDVDAEGDADAVGEKDDERDDNEYESEEDTRKEVDSTGDTVKTTANGGVVRRWRLKARVHAQQPYANGTKAAPAAAKPPTAAAENTETGDGSIVDRLQIELAALRRQSAETITRLSDELTQAQADASRTRNALNSTQAHLDEESRRRKDAERVVEGLRRAGVLQGFQPVNAPMNLGPNIAPPPPPGPHMHGPPIPGQSMSMSQMPGAPMPGPPTQGPPQYQ
ncbi:hypothetical protein BD626DRAFT_487197 [Schizophyllum amplum]|uniref:Uncharacterized protein n=1 Tax=Schizophyllum amplum TaxID=97359 RepID=A0A550CN65_9AGAR|nr:hypothetical protein BD626DRAFT_487197 [Auriculariopsis ampla]